MTFLNRQGTMISKEEYQRLCDLPDYSHVCITLVHEYEVCTDWYGRPVFFRDEVPLIFETTIWQNHRLIRNMLWQDNEQSALQVHQLFLNYIQDNIHAIRATGLEEFLEVENDLGLLQGELAQLQ